jgi:hypothetical protein
MNKRWLAAGAVVAAATIGTASTAAAAPKNEPEIFDCGSGPVEIVTNGGPNGWFANGTKYRAVLIQATDPAGNIVYVKARGNPRELSNPEAITCTSSDDEGTIMVIAIPA